MNILGIRGPSLTSNRSYAISPSVPIGLAYIIGAISDLDDVNIQVIDALLEKPSVVDLTKYNDELSLLGADNASIMKLINIKPDVCLISGMFSSDWPINKELINLIKQEYENCVLVGGGEHLTAMPEYCLENSSLDVVIMGEGEVTVRELVIHLQEHKGLTDNLPGTCVRIGNKIVRNEVRPRERAVDSIRPPAWEYFKVENFLDKGMSSSSSEKSTTDRPFNILATRGCPYQCTFCSNPSMWTTRWVARPVGDVVNEMKGYIEKYGVTHFDFSDLTLAVNKRWLVSFANLLIEENLGVSWGLPSGSRSEVLDEETLPLIKKAGINDLTYAPENGSDEILKIMNKRIKKDKMLKSIRLAGRNKIRTRANIIFGYPEEKRRDIVKSYWFVMRMAWNGLQDIQFLPLTIYPGSKVFEQIRKQRNIKIDEQYFLNLSHMASLSLSPSYSNHYGSAELLVYRVVGYLLFYSTVFVLRPSVVLKVSSDIIFRTSYSRLGMGVGNVIRRWIKLRLHPAA
ncbi:B12-binding domain-containing radical SAM protein [Gammaproteobacteria bacterium]|nr:B12-binding domain-containing radical SAM protein [Gammaproteobacteria bacterium]